MKFSQKQNEFIRNANHRYNLKIGAVRSGKSYVDIAYTVPSRLRDVKDRDGLNFIIGVSKETIERNVLQPMREIYTDAIVSTINSRNIAYVCGVPVYCIGAEKISQLARLQGASIKYCYGDEIAKWNPEVFAMLQSRLDKAYSRFDGACNPEFPTHWLKKFIDRQDIDAYVQKYTIFDNPFLPKEFVDNLCREYAGTVYYKRYIDGEWALADGLIYPMHEEATIDSIPDFSLPQAEEICLAIDYGTQNAFAAIVFVKFHEIWYAIDEYYYSGRDSGEQKTDEEYANDLDEFLEPYFEACVPEGHKLETIIDPSASSFITLLQKRERRIKINNNSADSGENREIKTIVSPSVYSMRSEIEERYKVRRADNSVEDGIRNTATAMKTGKLKILRTLTAWHTEVQGYAWDSKSGEDKPLKINDHAMDATRYFVQTKNITKIRRSL